MKPLLRSLLAYAIGFVGVIIILIFALIATPYEVGRFLGEKYFGLPPRKKGW